MSKSVTTESKTTRKFKPYPKYKDSGIGWMEEIPEHWEVLQLRRIVNKFVDYRGRTPEKVESGIPLITARNIKNGNIDLSLSKEYMKEDDYKDWMVRGLPEHGDVLVTTEAPLGETAQIEDTNIALAQRIILLKIDTYSNYNDYLKYYFLSESGQGELCSRATGSTAFGIKAEHFKGICIIRPLKDEQTSIASFLDRETSSIDTLISKKERQIELLQEKRSALISHAVTKGLPAEAAAKAGLDPDVTMKDSGVEWLGEIPEGWEVKKLKYIVDEKLKYGANEAAELDDRSLPRYIRITDFDDGGNLREMIRINHYRGRLLTNTFLERAIFCLPEVVQQSGRPFNLKTMMAMLVLLAI